MDHVLVPVWAANNVALVPHNDFPAMERHQRHQLLRVCCSSREDYHLLTLPRPFIFDDLGLRGSTNALLATGVVGILEFLFTIPAVLWVDRFGRKTILIAGAIGMACCHFIVAGLIGGYTTQWNAGQGSGAGWAAIVFVWVFVINFAYSWGPVAWIVSYWQVCVQLPMLTDFPPRSSRRYTH